MAGARTFGIEGHAARVGLYVATHAPGDGVRRYRFFRKPGNSYCGPDSGIYTALGAKEAMTFLAGYSAGKDAV